MYRAVTLCNFGKKEKERFFVQELETACARRDVITTEIDLSHLIIELGGAHGVASVLHEGVPVDINTETYYMIRLARRHPITSLFVWLLNKRSSKYMDAVHIYHEAFTDKAFQVIALAEAGVSVPHSLILPAETLFEQIETVESRLRYPFVFKSRGARGTSVYEVKDRTALQQAYRAMSSQGGEVITLQEIVPNEYDIRALVFRDRVIGAMRRSGEGFLNNVSQGGEAQEEVLTPTERFLCTMAAGVVGLDFAGVDFIRTEQGAVFLEINKSPQLGGIRSIYPSLNIGEEVVQMLETDLRPTAKSKITKTAKIMIAAAQRLGMTHTMMGRATFTLHHAGKDETFIDVMPESTSAIAEVFARNKYVGSNVLREWGLPVLPSSRYLDLASAEAFLHEHAPIVVKPVGDLHGNGVSVGVTTVGGILPAVEHARRHDESGRTLLEKQASGFDHRILVVGKKQVFVLKKVPPTVVGDGVSTIEELVLLENTRRVDGGNSYLKPIRITKAVYEMLAAQNVLLESVLPQGQHVTLSAVSNITQGARTIDQTTVVSKKVKETAIAVAEKMCMEVLGLDIMSEDITDENKEFFIIEMNNYPGIEGHMYPSEGEGHDVATAIIKAIFTIA